MLDVTTFLMESSTVPESHRAGKRWSRSAGGTWEDRGCGDARGLMWRGGEPQLTSGFTWKAFRSLDGVRGKEIADPQPASLCHDQD